MGQCNAAIVLVVAVTLEGVDGTRVDVIVGLGNPGRRYRYTRHNLGFDVIDALACQYNIPMQQHECQAICGQGRVGSQAVLLVKPQTYMNASGHAVAPLVRRYRQAHEQLIVVHDDIDLPLGKIRVRQQGSAAGHLGVRSLIECLGSEAFVRVRLGVGRPPHKEDIVDYVLSPFAAEEMDARDMLVAQAVACIEKTLGAGGG
ncbi:MAG TPA: aminoacyl-tRNA hydrolase [Candidatus Tectomicrobia bacterium]